MSEKRKDNPIFRTRLKQLLKERDLNQGKFADELTNLLIAKDEENEERGISRRTVNFWCNGKAYPTEENLTAICEFFNVRKSWLYGESKYRTEREEMFSKYDEIYKVDADIIEFVEIIERKSKKSLMFEEDGTSFEEYVSECIKECLSIAEKKGIEMQDRKSIIRRKKR